jgi:formate hydrogenlyase subunit 4
MVLFLLRFIATILHAAAMFGLAPLLAGLAANFRARLLGRRGPPIVQPYRDLRKLILKTPLIPDTATELYKIWPFAGLAATAAAALLVPGFALNLATARCSDLITLAGLFALSRGAAALAGLETGFGFGGAGAARDALFGVFSGAALLILVLIFVLVTGDATVDGISQVFSAGQMGISISLGFALAAMLGVALSETGRMPSDHPGGHQELGMVRQAASLEYSGRYLALFRYTEDLRLMVWFSLIATIFLPFGIAEAGSVLSWPLGLLAWAAKLCALAAGLSLLEVSVARMRIFRVPEFLGAALLLGLLSAIFLFVAGHLNG